MSGIYKIQSVISPERCYVGSAVHIRNRWTNHLKGLRNNKHGNGRLQNHYNKYGKDDLVFIILEPCFPEFLLIREQYYIDTLKPFFNICKNAGNVLGLKRTPESRKKQSELYRGENSAMFGKRHTPESIKLMSEGHKGHKSWNKGKKGVSETTSEKMRKAWEHREPISEETREKMSLSQTGEANSMYGKKHSEESKRKNRESQLGKKRGPMSEESKQKLSNSKKGKKRKPFSEEHRRNLSKSLIGNTRTLGYKQSDETKLKVSQSLIGNKRAVKKQIA